MTIRTGYSRQRHFGTQVTPLKDDKYIQEQAAQSLLLPSLAIVVDAKVYFVREANAV
jgi:hypothetical protein